MESAVLILALNGVELKQYGPVRLRITHIQYFKNDSRMLFTTGMSGI